MLTSPVQEKGIRKGQIQKTKDKFFVKSHLYITFATQTINRLNTMSSKLTLTLRLMARYKYLIVVVLGVAFVGFIDDDSLLQLVRYNIKVAKLKEEIAVQNERNEAATRQLQELRKDPKSIERIARERYFMKSDDEDIFVLSDDPSLESNSDPTITSE